MKKVISLLSICLLVTGTSLPAADNTYLDYQNYNHGYCPECNCAPCSCEQPCDPCDPCEPCSYSDPHAPYYGAEAGISLVAIGIGVAAVAVAAAIIIASGSGSSTSHTHS